MRGIQGTVILREDVYRAGFLARKVLPSDSQPNGDGRLSAVSAPTSECRGIWPSLPAYRTSGVTRWARHGVQ